MEKSKFERFVGKYNLGGSCESVLYKVEPKKMSVRSISDDKNVLCEVEAAGSMGFAEGEFAVYETQRLRNLLNVLPENITVQTKKSGDRSVGLEFTDGSTDVTFVLADVSVIPQVPDVKTLPPFELTLQMDEQFIGLFIKAKGALQEVETFTVFSDGKDASAKVVLGYSAMNTNRVKLTVTTKETKKLEPISFSAKYLREILQSNKDAKTGELQVSSKGLAKTTFASDGITATYYLVQIDTKD